MSTPEEINRVRKEGTDPDIIDIHYEFIQAFRNALFYGVYVILAYIILSLHSHTPFGDGTGISWQKGTFLYVILFGGGILATYYNYIWDGATQYISIGILMIWIWIQVFQYRSVNSKRFGAKGMGQVNGTDPTLVDNVRELFINIKSNEVRISEGVQVGGALEATTNVSSYSTDKFITTSLIIQFIALTAISIYKKYPSPQVLSIRDAAIKAYKKGEEQQKTLRADEQTAQSQLENEKSSVEKNTNAALAKGKAAARN